MVRASALLVLGGALGAYTALAHRLPELPLAADIAIIALAIIPATFAMVWLALPVRSSGYLLPATVVLAGLAVFLEAKDLDVAANYVKLAAAAGAGLYVIRFFEAVSWIVLVALLIIPVDAYSVAQGPTRQILEEEPGIFDRLSVAFPAPGDTSGAQLGLPDVFFFSLFLAAADRFGLRVGFTWLLCTASFGLTLVLGVSLDVSGLPALPLLSAGFILANADLLWRRLRRRSEPPALGPPSSE